MLFAKPTHALHYSVVNNLQAMEEIGVDDGQEEAVEVDVDYSTDSAVLVNGNEGEEQWGMNNEGTPSA